MLNELHLKCKSELYVWKKGVYFLLGYIFFSPLHPNLYPSRPVMALTVFFREFGGVRGVKKSGGKKTKDMQREVPGKGRH